MGKCVIMNPTRKVGEMSFNRNQYNIDYKKEHFDRIGVVFPKGSKEKIKQAAADCGLSAGEFIRQAIQEKIDRM